jgi:uncharacterized coiled-coil protein SlyX
MSIDHDFFRWVVGGLIGILTSISGFWLSHLNNRIDVISSEALSRAQIISGLEANMHNVNKRLDRIESKLDYLIERKSK